MSDNMVQKTLELLGRAIMLLKIARSIHEDGSEDSCGFEYAKQIFFEELAAMNKTTERR